MEIKNKMNNRLIKVILMFLFVTKISAQSEGIVAIDTTTERYLKTYSKIDLSFSGLGFAIETPISDRVLLEFAVGLGAGYKVNEDFKYRMYFNDPAIYSSVAAKYYINKKTQVKKGTSERLNSGNFFALKSKYVTPTLRDSKTWDTMLVALHWGLQRNIGKHFVYQLTLGIGGAIDMDDKTSTHLTLYPDVNFRFSYILPF